MLHIEFIRQQTNRTEQKAHGDLICKKINVCFSDSKKIKLEYDVESFSLSLSKQKFIQADIQDIGYLCATSFPNADLLQVSIDTDIAALYSTETWLTWLSFGLSLSHYQYKHIESEKLNISCAEFNIKAEYSALLQAVEKGKYLAKGQLIARELVNKPGNIIYPETFVDAVKDAFNPNIEVTALDAKQMQSLGFGGLLSIAQGSEKEARLLKMEYCPEQPKAKIVFVGKGVTFDSGGISIKQPRFMSTMKTDMGGAAAVAGAVHAIAELGLPVHVIGLCGLVENMPSGHAIKPGDVVKMHSGKFVEIITTDAEGRMVLADLLHYAQQEFQPDYLIDIATLTGATGISLGKAFASLMGNDQELIEHAKKAGDACGEPVWHMPIAEDLFEASLESDFADIRHGSEEPDGSACVAATFLNHFVTAQQKWIHIDSAAMSLGMQHRKIYPNAASGFGVLLLVALVEQLIAQQNDLFINEVQESLS